VSEWLDYTPGWRDSGQVELLRKDATVAKGKLIIDDVEFDGEDEHPVWKLILEDGSESSIWDFEGWRSVK
jgi:hypothetical protein